MGPWVGYTLFTYLKSTALVWIAFAVYATFEPYYDKYPWYEPAGIALVYWLVNCVWLGSLTLLALSYFAWLFRDVSSPWPLRLVGGVTVWWPPIFTVLLLASFDYVAASVLGQFIFLCFLKPPAHYEPKAPPGGGQAGLRSTGG